MEEKKVNINDISISFYKNPKTGLSINNTFKNLLKAGHKVTFRQIDNVIKNFDEITRRKPTKNRNIYFSRL